MVWYSHLLQNFPQFTVIHTVKGFGIVNKAEIDVVLELSCFFDDPADVGNVWSLVALPFLKQAWTSGSSWFYNLHRNNYKTYCKQSIVMKVPFQGPNYQSHHWIAHLNVLLLSKYSEQTLGLPLLFQVKIVISLSQGPLKYLEHHSVLVDGNTASRLHGVCKMTTLLCAHCD